MKFSEEECRDKDITFSAPVVRRGDLRQQGHRRDQGAGGLPGRLPHDDRPRHLHHQRHRARRGLPAGALAGRLLQQGARQDHRQGHLHREDHPVARRLARVRRRQEGHRRRSHRPQAPAERHRLPEGARLQRGRDPQALRQRALRSRTPSRRTTSRPRRRPSRTSTASSGRASRPRPRARRRSSRTCSSTPSATTSRGSDATRWTRSWAPPRAKLLKQLRAHHKGLGELDNPDKKAWEQIRYRVFARCRRRRGRTGRAQVQGGPHVRGHPQDGRLPREAARRRGRLRPRRHRPLRQPPHPHRSAS